MQISKAEYFEWDVGKRISWRNQWLALVGENVSIEKPATMPLTSWNHYVAKKNALLVNDSLDPVEIMRVRCYRAFENGDYQSCEEWEKQHMVAENRAYWKSIVDKEMVLIKEYFGSDKDGLEKWMKQYEKYIKYANG